MGGSEVTGEGWRDGENDWCLRSVLAGFLLVEEHKIEWKEPWGVLPCSRPRSGDITALRGPCPQATLLSSSVG